MTEQEHIEQLKKEGWENVAVVRAEPGTEYPEHTHVWRTVHVILKGDITLVDAEGTRTLAEGERFEIPAGAVHSAACGSRGCTFVVGEKRT